MENRYCLNQKLLSFPDYAPEYARAFLEFDVNHFRPKIEMNERTKLIKKAFDLHASKQNV